MNIQYQQDREKHLVEVVQKLSLAKDLNDIMEIVRKKARQLTGADGATFVLRDEEMCYYADEDAISPLWKGSRFPISVCISGWSMLNREPAIVEDIYQDDRIPIEAYKPTFVKSLVMVPIRTMDPIGAIGNYWAEQHLPTEDEIEVLQSLADITAVAMQNVNIYNEMEKRVRERTAQLEAFSYTISHDLQNPLAGMEMHLNFLQEEQKKKEDKDTANAIQNLKTSVTEMQEMIQGLLDFSRLGERGVEIRLTDMEDLVRTVCRELTPPEEGRSINIEIGDLTTEQVDQQLFKRVWTNLVSNALKYTKQKEVVEIEIGMEERKGERVYYIKDNGAGFDQGKANEMFKAFKRLKNSKEDFKGTGVGLSLVQQIIFKHGGSIWAEGQPNKGAIFYFSLPWKRKGGKGG